MDNISETDTLLSKYESVRMACVYRIIELLDNMSDWYPSDKDKSYQYKNSSIRVSVIKSDYNSEFNILLTIKNITIWENPCYGLSLDSPISKIIVEKSIKLEQFIKNRNYEIRTINEIATLKSVLEELNDENKDQVN